MGCGINGTRAVMERGFTSPDRHCCHCPVHPKLGRGGQRVTAALGEVPSTGPPSSWLQSAVAA